MANQMAVLKNMLLFSGINTENGETEKLLNCLNPVNRSYAKNEIVFLAGTPITQIGIVLSGGVRIIREDFAGNTNIITELGVGDIFGESIVCSGLAESDISVRAASATDILFLDYKKIITSCQSACPFHSKLIFNMLKILAEKNVFLNEKVEVLSKRSTRDKLMTYFYLQAKQANDVQFSIPFNREELADYLCVDRSAMSRELCRMRDEGMIEFYKNAFIIKE